MELPQGCVQQFTEVKQWLRFPCEDKDFLDIGQIPKAPLIIGISLGLSEADVDEITRDTTEHRERTLKLLQRWKAINGSNATWWELAQCLQRLEDEALLERVKSTIQARYARVLIVDKDQPTTNDEVISYLHQEYAKIYRDQEQQRSQKERESGFHEPIWPDDEPPASISCLASRSPPTHHECVMEDGQTSQASSPCLTSYQCSDSSHESVPSKKSLYYTPICSSESESHMSGPIGLRINPQPSPQSPSQQQLHLVLNPVSSPPAMTPPPLTLLLPQDLTMTPTSGSGGLYGCGESHGSEGVKGEPERVPGGEPERVPGDCECVEQCKEMNAKRSELERVRRLVCTERERSTRLGKQLVRAETEAFYRKRQTEELQSKLDEHKGMLDWLFDHIKDCDQKILDMYWKHEQLKVDFDDLRRQKQGENLVHVDIAVLREMNAHLTQELQFLQTRYDQAQHGLAVLSQELREAESQQSQLALEKKSCQEEKMHLCLQLAELTLDNQELREVNYRLQECIKILSPPGTCPLEGNVFFPQSHTRQPDTTTEPSQAPPRQHRQTPPTVAHENCATSHAGAPGYTGITGPSGPACYADPVDYLGDHHIAPRPQQRVDWSHPQMQRTILEDAPPTGSFTNTDIDSARAFCS